MRILPIIPIVLALAGCVTPAPSPAPAPTRTAAPTAAPSPTVDLAPSATPAALSATSEKQALDTYQALIMMQASASLLDETARRYVAGELQGPDGLATVMVLGTLSRAVDEVVAQHVPAPVLAPHWEEARPIHDKTRALVAGWIGREITPDRVVSEIASPLAEFERVLSEAEDLLRVTYGLDSAELERLRTEFQENVRKVMNTPTPPPESARGPVEAVSGVS